MKMFISNLTEINLYRPWNTLYRSCANTTNPQGRRVLYRPLRVGRIKQLKERLDKGIRNKVVTSGIKARLGRSTTQSYTHD